MQYTHNVLVPGSNPGGPTSFLHSGLTEHGYLGFWLYKNADKFASKEKRSRAPDNRTPPFIIINLR